MMRGSAFASAVANARFAGDLSAPAAELASDIATFTDATGALSLVAPSNSYAGQLTFDDGPGLVVAGADPADFHTKEHELTRSGATLVASPRLAERLGLSAGNADWFPPLTDWVAREIGSFNGGRNAYGGGEAWTRESAFNDGAYHGISRSWHDCGEHGRTIRDVAVIPTNRSFVAYLRVVHLPSEQEIAHSIVNSFEVDGAAL